MCACGCVCQHFECSVSGCTDYFAPDEKSALQICRDIVATLNVHHNEIKGRLPAASPLYDPEEISSLVPSSEQHKLDMYQVIILQDFLLSFARNFSKPLLSKFIKFQPFIVNLNIVNFRWFIGKT